MEGRSGTALRRERVVFETDRHLIVGEMALPAEGYQARFSDVINRGDVSFVPLTKVEIAPLGGGQSSHRDFIVLAKAHVRFAYPMDGDTYSQ